MTPLGLQFKLDDVPEDPRAFQGEIATDALDEVLNGLLGDLGYAARGPAQVTGSVYRSKRDLFVEAEVQVQVGYGCVRCLDPLSLTVKQRVRHLLVPGARDDGKSAIELAEDEVTGEDDLDHYDGERIDLVPLLREDILLELPMNPTCEEATAGRCARFEAVFESPAPEEDAAPVDPRWAPLLELKKKLN